MDVCKPFLISLNIANAAQVGYRKTNVKYILCCCLSQVIKNLFHLITTLRCSNIDQDSQPNTHTHAQPTQHPHAHAHTPTKEKKKKRERRRRERGPAPH